MNKKHFLSVTIWLIIFGLLNLFASGRWTVAAAAWTSSAFALRYLYVHPQRRKFLYFYLVLWLTLSVAWYGATPIWGAAHFIFMAVNALIGGDPVLC